MKNMQSREEVFATIPEDIKAFLESILDEAGMAELEEEQKRGMLVDLYRLLDKFLFKTLLSHIPAESIDEFTDHFGILTTMEERQKYLLEKVPNASELISQALMDFKTTYLEGVDNVVDEALKQEKGEL